MTNIVFTPKNASVLFKKSYTYDTLMIHLNIHLNTKKRLQCVLWTYYSRKLCVVYVIVNVKLFFCVGGQCKCVILITVKYFYHIAVAELFILQNIAVKLAGVRYVCRRRIDAAPVCENSVYFSALHAVFTVSIGVVVFHTARFKEINRRTIIAPQLLY